MPNTILDVDESILTKQLRLTELSKDEESFNEILQSFDNKDNVPSVTFRPLPGLCIKTKTDDGNKIFINLCHGKDIPPPEDISDEKFFSILNEAVPSWVVPMSIGHQRHENSKDGTPCLTYDIAINSNFFQKIEAKKHYLTFVILTIISAIETKHDKTLDTNSYVILKHKKVMGTLHDHRVEKRQVRKPTAIPSPLIEELPTNKKTEKLSKSTEKSASTNEDVSQNYCILKKPKSGNTEMYIGYFKLPNQAFSDDVHVNIGDDRIVVDVSKFNYLVDIFVPFVIATDKVTASIDPNLQILKLNMPV